MFKSIKITETGNKIIIFYKKVNMVTMTTMVVNGVFDDILQVALLIFFLML